MLPPAVQISVQATETALIAIVIVIIPVAIVVPAMLMLIPPRLAFSPAPFASFVQFLAPVICLPAEVSMVLNGLVEFMLRLNSTPLATIVCRRRGHHEDQPRSQRGQG
jgi:hypothetical protein